MMNKKMITRVFCLAQAGRASNLHAGERVLLDFNMRMLTAKNIFWSLVGGCLLVSGVGADEAVRPTQPNVLLIVVDDLGWQDVKCYDIDEPSPMETPNIDGFAKQGVLFRQAYSPAPVCSPSRAAILSGVHPARAQHIGVAGGNPPRPERPEGYEKRDKGDTEGHPQDAGEEFIPPLGNLGFKVSERLARFALFPWFGHGALRAIEGRLFGFHFDEFDIED